MKRDLLFFFAPVFVIMTGICAAIVSACLAEPNPDGVTGPSGSDMVCAFYFILHLILWLLVGLVMLGLYYRRYHGVQILDDYDKPKLVLCSLVGGGLLILAMVVAPNFSEFLRVTLASILVNLVPLALVVVVGFLVTTRDRKRIASGVRPVQADTVFRPNLR